MSEKKVGLNKYIDEKETKGGFQLLKSDYRARGGGYNSFNSMRGEDTSEDVVPMSFTPKCPICGSAVNKNIDEIKSSKDLYCDNCREQIRKDNIIKENEELKEQLIEEKSKRLKAEEELDRKHSEDINDEHIEKHKEELKMRGKLVPKTGEKKLYKKEVESNKEEPMTEEEIDNNLIEPEEDEYEETEEESKEYYEKRRLNKTNDKVDKAVKGEEHDEDIELVQCECGSRMFRLIIDCRMSTIGIVCSDCESYYGELFDSSPRR